jgi:hypothetical protein
MVKQLYWSLNWFWNEIWTNIDQIIEAKWIVDKLWISSSVFEKYWLMGSINHIVDGWNLWEGLASVWKGLWWLWVVGVLIFWMFKLWKKWWWIGLLWLIWGEIGLRYATWKWFTNMLWGLLFWWFSKETSDIMKWLGMETKDSMKNDLKWWSSDEYKEKIWSPLFLSLIFGDNKLWDMKKYVIKEWWKLSFDYDEYKKSISKDDWRYEIINSFWKNKFIEFISKWFEAMGINVGNFDKVFEDNKNEKLSIYYTNYKIQQEQKSKEASMNSGIVLWWTWKQDKKTWTTSSWWQSNTQWEQKNNLQISKAKIKTIWYTTDWKIFLLWKDWTPRQFDFNMLSSDVKKDLEKYSKLESDLKDKIDMIDDIWLIISSYIKHNPDKKWLEDEYKKICEEFIGWFYNWGDLNVLKNNFIKNIWNVLNKIKHKKSSDITGYLRMSWEQRKLWIYNILRKNWDYDLVATSILENKFEKTWLSNGLIEEFTDIILKNGLSNAKEKLKSEKFNVIMWWFKSENEINKFLEKIYIQKSKYDDYMKKNINKISTDIKSKFPWDSNRQNQEIEKAKKYIEYGFMSIMIKKEFFNKYIESNDNTRRADKFVDMFADIQWLWYFDLADSTKDFSNVILETLLIEAIALWVWAVTAGVWMVGVNALAYWTRWVRWLNRMYRTQESVNMWVKATRWIWSTSLEWFMFYEWANIVHNIFEKNAMFKWALDGKEIWKSILFIWAMKWFSQLFSKVPWLKSTYETEWNWIINKTFKLWWQVSLEWLAIWWIAWSLDIVFEQWEYKIEHFLEWIMLAILFKLMRWWIEAGKNFIVNRKNWKTEITEETAESETVVEPKPEISIIDKLFREVVSKKDYEFNGGNGNFKISNNWKDITITEWWKEYQYDIKKDRKKVMSFLNKMSESDINMLRQELYLWKIKEKYPINKNHEIEIDGIKYKIFTDSQWSKIINKESWEIITKWEEWITKFIEEHFDYFFNKHFKWLAWLINKAWESIKNKNTWESADKFGIEIPEWLRKATYGDMFSQLKILWKDIKDAPWFSKIKTLFIESLSFTISGKAHFSEASKWSKWWILWRGTLVGTPVILSSPIFWLENIDPGSLNEAWIEYLLLTHLWWLAWAWIIAFEWKEIIRWKDDKPWLEISWKK